jgi:hypothetical protein
MADTDNVPSCAGQGGSQAPIAHRPDLALAHQVVPGLEGLPGVPGRAGRLNGGSSQTRYLVLAHSG